MSGFVLLVVCVGDAFKKEYLENVTLKVSGVNRRAHYISCFPEMGFQLIKPNGRIHLPGLQ